MVDFNTAIQDLESDPSSRDALQACVASMVDENELGCAPAREVVYQAVREQGLVGVELVALLLSSMAREHRVATLVDGLVECQFRLGDYDVGVRDGRQHFPDACEVVAIRDDDEHEFMSGRRMLIDMLMDPGSVLPPKEGATPIWRAMQIEKFVSQVRKLGLIAPPVDVDRLDESEPFGISFGDAMTNVRGGEFANKWSVARFRAVHQNLVYRCRFIRTEDPESSAPAEPDYVECDPRFATAPSGSARYVAPKPASWGVRGHSSCRQIITPFGHTVDHVGNGDTAWRIQTPYDLLSAVRNYSNAWLAGQQRSAEKFMSLVGGIGMSDWFKPSSSDGLSWALVHERHKSSLDVSFVKQEDGFLKAKLQFSFAESTIGCKPVWVKTPRRLYEIVRDAFWLDADGRKQYKPGDVAPWISAVHEDRPTDDGVG